MLYLSGLVIEGQPLRRGGGAGGGGGAARPAPPAALRAIAAEMIPGLSPDFRVQQVQTGPPWHAPLYPGRHQRRFLAKAVPDGDLRYLSKATAFSSSSNATQVLIAHGTYFDVWETSPALCLAGRA